MKNKSAVTAYLLSAIALCCGMASRQEPAPSARPHSAVRGVYISTGDNHWLGQSLAVDSPASIAAAFDLFKEVYGARRVYWRGLQEAAWVETFEKREDSFRCGSSGRWFKHLISDARLEPLAAETAHARGMELWGVSTIGDWGSSADTPSFYDYPFHGESKLRLEHPEWVPVDKHGYRRQGGTIELAYPEARKALVDLHTRLAVQAGYDGVLFISYVENFSLRFQDEFGFSEPIVAEFKRRHGIDIRHEAFTRNASRDDWYRLRGEYLTAYLRELKAALKPHGIKLGMFVDPRTPRFPLLWATLPHTYYTLGHIYFDLETWVREGIVDELCVYGAAAQSTQIKTIEDCLWLTRGCATKVTFTTSSPLQSSWEAVYQQGPESVLTLGEDEAYLLRSGLPEQAAAALTNGSPWQQMRFLSQVAEGVSTAETAALLPFASHTNVILRRLALTALGTLKDPAALPVIEQALLDPEVGVRSRALLALGRNHGPNSVDRIFESLGRFNMHPVLEAARTALPAIKPFPREQLARVARSHTNAAVRTVAIRSVERAGALETDVAWLREALDDPDGYAAFSAAEALGTVRNSAEAVHTLLRATKAARAAVADRAATSLAKIARRDEPGLRELRPQMLAALETLFAKMGDGCAREDREWGYRPAGDALLAFGEEGEAVLKRLMAQDRDRRLAELAWRVLSFREKSGENAFNIITEKEDEAAFRARPSWMKTNRVARLTQGFERSGLFGTNTVGTVGVAASKGGRWSGFGPRGPSVDATCAMQGAQSVRLVRGGGVLTGWVNADAGIGAAVDFEAGVWVRRGQGGAFLLSARDRHGRDTLSLLVNAQGEACLPGGTGTSAWQPTGLVVPAGVWTRIELDARRGKGAYTAAVAPQGGPKSRSAQAARLSETGEVTQIQLSPQGEPGAATHVDEITLSEWR